MRSNSATQSSRNGVSSAGNRQDQGAMRFFRFAFMSAAGMASLLAFTPPATAEETLASGSWLLGTLRLVHTHHSNGTRIDAYQIVSEPRQMPASDDFCVNPDGKA